MTNTLDELERAVERLNRAVERLSSGMGKYGFANVYNDDVQLLLSDEPPMWFRAVAEVLRPRSIIILLALAGCVSLFWIS